MSSSSYGLWGLARIIFLFSTIYLMLAPIKLSAQDVKTSAPAPAVVRAKSEAAFSSSLAGTIEDLPFKEGELFEAGDVLVSFGCAVQHAEAEAAEADHQAAQAEFNAGKTLLARGGIGTVQVAVFEAQAAAAKARQNLAEAVVAQCKIIAPYKGLIVELAVNEFEYVQPSQPLLNIVAADRPELEISAPAAWLRWIDIGSVGEFTLSDGRKRFEIQISNMGAVVDPVSDTIKLNAEFTGDISTILPGMSGLVSFFNEKPD